MRPHTTLLLVLLSATGLAQTKPAPPPPPITFEQAVANEQTLFAADQKHGMDALELLVADEFVDIAEDGSSIGRAALMKEIPTLKLLRYAQKNYRVVAMGPYAYSISYDSDATVIGADGKEKRSQHGLNTVWIWRNDRWQILMHCRGDQKVLTGK